MKILRSKLKEHGIDVEIPSTFKHAGYFEVDCPKDYCKTARRGSQPTPLRVDIVPPSYAKWRCSHCLWSDHIGEAPPEVPEVVNDTPTEDFFEAPAKPSNELIGEALLYLQRYGITPEAAKLRRLTWRHENNSIKIPYFENGELINFSLVNIETDNAVLHSPKRVVFYGLDRFNPNVASAIITQRELDAITLSSLGFDNVLAVPPLRDTEDAFRYVAAAAEILKGCDIVSFALDDTEQGLILRQELSRRIGAGKCKVATFTCGTLRQTHEEHSLDWVCQDIQEAKPLPISGLYEIQDFENELNAYFLQGMAAGVSTGWPNIDALYTVAVPQMTLVTGIPNSGKSEFLDALCVNLALNHGWKFAAFSPENGKEPHATKLIEKRVEMSADPKNNERMSFDTFQQGALWVSKHWTFIESKDEMPTLDWILERAADAVLRKGIKGLIIDPWNRIEKKMDGFRAETDYVAWALPRILRFNANYGVHTWLVVHPKQQEKDRKTGKIPPPSLYDCAGSAHFVNMCDNGIVVHRADSVDDATEIHVNKIRFKHIGRKGNTKLAYNVKTGRYAPLDQEPVYSYGGKKSDGIKSYEFDYE